MELGVGEEDGDGLLMPTSSDGVKVPVSDSVPPMLCAASLVLPHVQLTCLGSLGVGVMGQMGRAIGRWRVRNVP